MTRGRLTNGDDADLYEMCEWKLFCHRNSSQIIIP